MLWCSALSWGLQCWHLTKTSWGSICSISHPCYCAWKSSRGCPSTWLSAPMWPLGRNSCSWLSFLALTWSSPGYITLQEVNPSIEDSYSLSLPLSSNKNKSKKKRERQAHTYEKGKFAKYCMKQFQVLYLFPPEKYSAYCVPKLSTGQHPLILKNHSAEQLWMSLFS